MLRANGGSAISGRLRRACRVSCVVPRKAQSDRRMTRQLALIALAPATPPPVVRPIRASKQPKNHKDILSVWTREEREQEDRAFWSGLCCRIPPRGVPQLWTCFGSRGERLMCSWCGWSFDRRTHAVKRTTDIPLRACPRCPVEHPQLRPDRLPDDENQGELFDGEGDATE
jgi:hypothetical protein